MLMRESSVYMCENENSKSEMIQEVAITEKKGEGRDFSRPIP